MRQQPAHHPEGRHVVEHRRRPLERIAEKPRPPASALRKGRHREAPPIGVGQERGAAKVRIGHEVAATLRILESRRDPPETFSTSRIGAYRRTAGKLQVS